MNNDGVDDIIAAFAMVDETPGGVRLWLNDGGKD